MLELTNVRKIYTTKAGDVAALDGVSIRFPEKGMVFVTGKSGSGKTTLLNVIGGLDGIDSGEIEVYGKKFSEFSQSEYDSYRNTLIGFIFQEYNLLPDYSIEKNVGIANELQGDKTDSQGVKDILLSVDILNYEGRSPNQFSGGQKQRVAIARALIKNPKIIMADEPTGALDSVTGIQVIEELKRLSKEKLVIVISHDLELANNYADRIIRLVDGKVVEDVTISEIEVDKNVYEDENLVTVKSGGDLDADETKVLVNAVKNRKKVKFTDDFRIKKKTPTDESAIEKSDEKIKFIKSKMKFFSAAMLGVKSLKVKPLRLIFTIILSAIAFAVFGVFDAVASYDRSRAISDLLQSGSYEMLTVSAENNSETGAVFKMNMSKEYIEELNDESGYNFRPIYNLYDFVRSEYSTVKSDNAYKIVNTKNSELPSVMRGRGYYYAELSGVIEFKNEEINDFYDIPSFGYTCVAGRYPKLSGTEDSTVGCTEIAISKYMADCIKHYVGDNVNYFEKPLTDDNYYEDLIDVRIKPKIDTRTGTPPFIIKGIYDCGDIPTKYHYLKEIYVSDKNDPNKAILEEFYAYISSGMQKLVMVAEGEIDYTTKYHGKPVAYFDEPAEYYIDDYSGGYSESMRGYFFSETSVPAENVVMFDTLYSTKDANGNDFYKDKSTYKLGLNEVLLNVTDLKLVFEREQSTFSYWNGVEYVDINDEFGDSYANVLKNEFRNLTQAGVEKNRELVESKIVSVFNIANKYLSPVTYPDRFSAKNPVYTRDIVLSRKVKATGITYDIPLKVVGVYFGMQNSSADSNYEAMVFSNDTLNYIGINTDQGRFPMATSKVNTEKKASDVVAGRLSKTEGVGLVWYGSTVMDTLAKNETWVSQFTDIFLYASIVLAVFSMFMLFNYISASIVSKRRSIGILRALGSNSGDVFKMFITESVIIALINGVLASVTAGIACMIVNNYLINVMHFIVRFALFTVRQVIVIFGISLIAALISSIVPIIKIAREKPVDLIRRT